LAIIQAQYHANFAGNLLHLFDEVNDLAIDWRVMSDEDTDRRIGGASVALEQSWIRGFRYFTEIV